MMTLVPLHFQAIDHPPCFHWILCIPPILDFFNNSHYANLELTNASSIPLEPCSPRTKSSRTKLLFYTAKTILSSLLTLLGTGSTALLCDSTIISWWSFLEDFLFTNNLLFLLLSLIILSKMPILGFSSILGTAYYLNEFSTFLNISEMLTAGYFN